jgi:myo-inositol-1(or 4)-monophosphatase
VSEFEDDLTFATAIVVTAGRLIMDRYERVERVDYKSARDIVTEVDHLSEELMIEAIRARFPGDAILAEESGGHKAAEGNEPTSGRGRCWIVDPLDGTINYANGIPFFCIAVALVEDGRPVVGVVHDPVRRESFATTATSQPTLAGRPVAASRKERLSDFVISMSLAGPPRADRARAVRKAVRVPRSMGSAALALAYVANGRFDAFIQRGGLSTWDIAAAGLIAERGGATLTDLVGGPWFDIAATSKSIEILAAPQPHHGALLELLRGR